MGTMAAGAPVDQAGRFADLAQREQVRALLERLGPKMRGGF